MTPPMVDPRDAELAACPNPCHLCGAPMIRDGKQWRHSPERGEGCFLFLQYLDDEDDIAAWNDVREPLRRPEPLAGSGVAGWLEPYRSRDAAGSPECALDVGWAWLDQIAVAERDTDPGALLIETPPLPSDGGSAVLYRGTSPIAAFFVIRDPLNFAILFRWQHAHPSPEQSAHCSGEVVEVVARVGTFPRIVSHEDALQAAKNFVDQHFNNRDGKGVLTSIPAKPDDDDVTLVDYIKQQRAIAALSAPRPDEGVVEALCARCNERPCHSLTGLCTTCLYAERGAGQWHPGDEA
jgi:hypothetical protein